MGALWLLGSLASALAVPPPPAAPPTAGPPPTPAELVTQLRQGERGDQQFAARELRRLVRESVRDESRAPPDSLRALEARQTLDALYEPLSLACITSLAEPRLLRTCAEILGLLEYPGALTPLEAVLATEPGWRSERAIREAIARIGDPT